MSYTIEQYDIYYHRYIKYKTKIILHSDKYYFSYTSSYINNPSNKDWVYASSFYAYVYTPLSSSDPYKTFDIPKGMNLYLIGDPSGLYNKQNVTTLEGQDGIRSITVSLDPVFNLTNTYNPSNSFVTYYGPVDGTSPLYIYRYREGCTDCVYATFTYEPQFERTDGIHNFESISPIYVLKDLGGMGYKGYTCINNICTPLRDKNTTTDLVSLTYEFNRCLTQTCTSIVSQTDNLIRFIHQSDARYNTIQEYYKGPCPYMVYVVLVWVLLIYLILVVIYHK